MSIFRRKAFGSSPKRLERALSSTLARFSVLIGLTAAYAALFFPLHQMMGKGAGILAIVPVVAATLLFGWRLGLVLVGLSVPANTLLLNAAGLAGWDAVIRDGGVPSVIVMIVIVLMISQMRTLNERATHAASERERIATNLQRQQRLLWTLIDNLPVATWVKDAESRFVLANELEAQWLGFDEPSEIVGKTDFDLHNQERAEQYYADEQIILETGEPLIEREEPIFLPSGEKRWLNTSKVPVFNEEGKVAWIVGINYDVTERRKAQDALREEKEKAEAATRAKSTFLASMSHEIRTPLNGIIGATDLLAKTALSEEQRDLVNLTQVSGDALMAVINDVLDFSKIEADKLELREEPFEVRRVVREALDLVAPRTQEKALETSADVDADVPETVIGDKDRLRQVLLNLLSNAVKFTHEEGAVTVRVHAKNETASGRHRLAFSVQDTGVGLTENEQRRIFSAFEQGENTHDPDEQDGTGLGLAISKRLCALMRGSITVESEKDVGSTFTFEIETGRASPAALESKTSGAETPEPGQDQASPYPLRILVVEDNPVNRKVIERLLTQLGYEADFANDGRAALTCTRQASYDVILMDVKLPKLDGLETTRRIRHRANSDSHPFIVALTARAMESDRERCLDAGMDDYLSKPVRLDALAKVLKRSIETISQKAYASAKEPAPAHGDHAVINGKAFEQLRGNVDGDTDFLRELVADYLDDAEGLVTTIDEACRREETETLERAAHTLKSSSRQLGALRLSEACAVLEKQAAAPPDDKEQIAKQAEAMHRQWKCVQKELRIRAAQLDGHENEEARP